MCEKEKKREWRFKLSVGVSFLLWVNCMQEERKLATSHERGQKLDFGMSVAVSKQRVDAKHNKNRHFIVIFAEHNLLITKQQ